MSLDAYVEYEGVEIAREQLGQRATLEMLKNDVIEAHKLPEVVAVCAAKNDVMPFRYIFGTIIESGIRKQMDEIEGQGLTTLLEEIERLPDSPGRVKEFKTKLRNLVSTAMEWCVPIKFH